MPRSPILIALMLTAVAMALGVFVAHGSAADETDKAQDAYDRMYPSPPLPAHWPEGNPSFSKPNDRLSIALLGPAEGTMGSTTRSRRGEASLPFDFQVLIHNEHWVERAFSRYEPFLRVVLRDQSGQYVTDVKAYAAALAHRKPHYPPLPALVILGPGETQEFKVRAQFILPHHLKPGEYRAQAILTNPQPWYIMDQMRERLVRVWKGTEIASPEITVRLR